MTGASGWEWRWRRGWGVAEIGDAGIPSLFSLAVNQMAISGEWPGDAAMQFERIWRSSWSKICGTTLRRFRKLSWTLQKHIAVDHDEHMMSLCTAGTSRPLRRSESVVEFVAKPIDVFDAVNHVIPVLPHSREG
jgi:hypothetical protein